MSSHREAPEISKDPVADSTDVYAFVSPDQPDTVTLIANYIPLQDPAGGPNFFEFGDDVLYEINIDNDGDGEPDVTYQFRFKTEIREPADVPLQHRPDRQRSTAPNWNRRQTYSVTEAAGRTVAEGPRARPRRARRATSARARRRTTSTSPTRRSRRCRPAEGLRRPAGRGLLRRPRLDLRPRRAAAVPEPPPDARSRPHPASTRPPS